MAKTSIFKRVLSSVLSAACVVSGTAFAGATLATQSGFTVNAATASDLPAFSWDNATVYFLLTDRFCNGDTTNDNAYGRQDIDVGDQRATFHGGDFAGITKKINEGYFNDLGVNAIWLTAPYEQIHGYIVGGSNYYHYSYHGYYVLDYTETDKAYGTEQEFQTLVDTAHEHGIRIVMDIVMNHAGYNSMLDMYEFNYGTLKSNWRNFYFNPTKGDTSGYHSTDNIDYDSSSADWGRWWGGDWVRAGLPGYTEGSNDDLTKTLEGLPDFKTEQSKQVSIPTFLKEKWQKNGTYDAKMAKYGSSNTVTGYISTWLAEWVEKYGVDGFRCDTAKHVEFASWKALKTKCVAALKTWKANNPTKKLDDLDFWMTGECWGHGSNKDGYYTDGGFDSMINFETQGGGLLAAGNVANVYSGYASKINNDDSFNVLSYISSHDTVLARGDQYYLGSAFLLLPGAVQIYYGDETCRPLVPGVAVSGDGHAVRSDMNWSSMDTNVLAHWQKVGTFRNNHLSVGGGQNVQLTASSGIAFGRTYSKNGITDKIAAVINAGSNASVTVNVGNMWPNGTQLHNYYDDTYATVSGGSVTFNSGAHGTILIEEPSGPRGVVNVTHINSTDGKTIKTETLSGGIGESYQTSALSMEGFTVSRTEGKTSGTFTEADINVKYYYSFDSSNYAYIVTKYVDASTNAEIADSVTETKRIGTTYTTTAATIKNYEIDTVPSNASGTVKSGTTTVTYKYNYVEPTNVIVHYKNASASSWGNVYVYAYDERSGSATEFTGGWPGTTMTKNGDWYEYSLDADWAQVIFNSGSSANKDPAGNKTPGYVAEGEVWITGGEVYPTGKVTVKYVGSDGKTLGSEVLKGMADGTNSYTTSAKTFTGYTLSSTPSNASGKYTEAPITVIYNYTSTNTDIPVTSVTLSKTTTNLVVGHSTTVTATVSPSNATNQTITWSTSNSSVATVSNGKITAKGAGTATVTAKSNNGKTATVTVKVTSDSGDIAVTGISLSRSTANLLVGHSCTATATITPSNATDQTVTWTSSNTTVATVSNGKITGKKAGTATITAKTSNGKTAKVAVTVKASGEVAVTGITLSRSTANLLVGHSCTATATITPSNATNQTVTWTSSNTTVATVSNGKITGKKAGTATITAKTSNGKTATVAVTVKSDSTTVAVTGITLSRSTANLLVGHSCTATATITPDNATNKTVTWTTSNSSIATVSNGKITAKGVGTCTITAKTNNGKTATVKVTVKADTSTALTNSSKLSKNIITLGTTVTLTGVASGGTSPYKYAFYYKPTTSSTYITLGTEFSSTSSTTFKPTSKGYYDIMISVKDSTGKRVDQTFALSVS